MPATAKAADREAELKHMPGPWVANGDEIRSGRSLIARIEPIHMCGGGSRATAANGRLISAAPDLLTALKLCVGFCSGHQETPEKVARYQQVLAAIAKAEGRS